MSRVKMPEAPSIGTFSHAPTASGSSNKASKASLEGPGLEEEASEFKFKPLPLMASKVTEDGLRATTLPENTGFSSGPVTCMTPLSDVMRG